MSFNHTQLELNLRCSMELLGRIVAEKGFRGRDWHQHPFFEVFYVADAKSLCHAEGRETVNIKDSRGSRV